MEDELNRSRNAVVTPNLNQDIPVPSLQLPLKPLSLCRTWVRPSELDTNLIILPRVPQPDGFEALQSC